MDRRTGSWDSMIDLKVDEDLAELIIFLQDELAEDGIEVLHCRKTQV